MNYYRENAGAAALAYARATFTGKPYVWGGESPLGADCSGVTQASWASVGVHLGRTTYVQFKQFQIPANSKLEAGDLLFIDGSDSVNGEPGHVMMYVSPGRVFQAQYTGGPLIGETPFDTTKAEYVTRPSLQLPPTPIAPVAPGIGAPAFVQNGNKVTLLKTVQQVNLAVTNGWTRYYYGVDGKFHPIFQGMPLGTSQYANVGYTHKRVA